MTPHEQALAEATALYRRTVDSLNRATDTEIMWSAIRAYLRTGREIDGAVLCVVPEECDFIDADEDDRAFENGWNACRTQTLASAEAPDV